MDAGIFFAVVATVFAIIAAVAWAQGEIQIGSYPFLMGAISRDENPTGFFVIIGFLVAVSVGLGLFAASFFLWPPLQ